MTRGPSGRTARRLPLSGPVEEEELCSVVQQREGAPKQVQLVGWFGVLIKVAESSHSHLLINFLHLSVRPSLSLSPFRGGDFFLVTFPFLSALLFILLLASHRIVLCFYRSAVHIGTKFGTNIL